MPKKRRPPKPRPPAFPSRRTVPAGRFKATCLAVMERVRQTGTPVTVTKHGVPLVQVIPAADPAAPPLFGRLKGAMRITGDIIAPVETEWTVLADD